MTTNRADGWWLWSQNPVAWVLWPLSMVFCLLVWLRRKLYQYHIVGSIQLEKPVVVVGNISLGGNGKTPLVQYLVSLIRDLGYTPAILTRGYKSDVEGRQLILSEGELSDLAGDEANMLSEMCACPIAIGADRVASGRQLLKQFPDVDILISDDGLQHYRLARDIEIVVERQSSYGNGMCIPAGPMRETRSRKQSVDVVVKRDSDDVIEQLGQCWNLADPSIRQSLSSLAADNLTAMTGIGQPQVFFEALSEHVTLKHTVAHADHHDYQKVDIQPYLTDRLLVTHKDAVKIRHLLDRQQLTNIWVVPLEFSLSDDLQYRLTQLLESRLNG